MNWFLLQRAISYFLTSGHKNGHGIHSPFLYNLISYDFKNNIDSSIVNRVERLRSDLISDKVSIEVNDLGSGSLKYKSSIRDVSEIARYSAVKSRYGRLLSIFAGKCNNLPIVELGTSLGIGTSYLALSATGSAVYTIEGCDNIARIAGQNFNNLNIKNVEQIIGSFDDQLERLLKRIAAPGLIFIDGNHSSGPLLRYIELLLQYVDNEAIIIIDDIHLTRDMEEGWELVRKMENFSLTVDIFQFGILFLRRGVRKQHFVIRY